MNRKSAPDLMILPSMAMIALFMVLSLLASLEDYMAKRDIEE